MILNLIIEKINSNPLVFIEIILLFLIDILHYIIGFLFIKDANFSIHVKIWI